MARYRIFNHAMPTTAAPAAVATGTGIKTLLQLKPFNQAKIVAWGISFDGSAAATPITVQLTETGAIFGTVTASADVDVIKLNGADQAASSVAGLTLGTTATGYTCTSEGSIVTQRMFDTQLIAPTNQYIYQFPLGQEPVLVIGNATRIIVKAGTTVNAICWIEIEL